MRQHFGHLLGLPAAVPPLPRSPLIPQADELFAEQRRLGLRHAVDALFPGEASTRAATVRFRILDGLQVPGRGRHWRLVNRERLHEARDARLAVPGADRSAITSLFTRYDRILTADPMGLRRLALYELVGLLQDHPRGFVTESAQELGVDPAEAEALAAAARLEPVRTAELRESAEHIVDAWRANRLHQTHAYARKLGDPGGDQRLHRFLRRIGKRRDQVKELLAQGERLVRSGAPAAGAALHLRATRIAVDEPAALAALLRATAAATDATPGPTPGAPPEARAGTATRSVTARILPDGVQVDWPGAVGTRGPYRVLRVRGTRWTELADATDRTALTDTSAPLGEHIRYAVLPLDSSGDRRIRELPAMSAPVHFAPDVGDPRLTDARARVTARWKTPPGARGVRVERHAAGPIAVTADRDGFTDEQLPPGEHSYTIRCRYRTADGVETTSRGVTVGATVHPWPEPVTGLDAAPGAHPGSIAVRWAGGTGAVVRFVDLPGPAPAEGSDALAEDLPAEVPWERIPAAATPTGTDTPYALELRPPCGTRARLTAVAVLGERACVGPSVSVEAPTPVEHLTVLREAPQDIRVTFDWPGDADRVLVRWEQSGHERSRTVTKSAYRTRGGLELTATTAGARFRAEPVVLAEADVIIPAEAGTAVFLPPYLAVSYDLVKPGWRAGRRRRVIVRTQYAGTGDIDDGPGGLPDFVLVARSGPGSGKVPPPRPRNPGDGATVLRLSGDEIGGGPVQRDIDIDMALGGEGPPYSLRAFLLGPRADSARLEEPPHERLVVR